VTYKLKELVLSIIPIEILLPDASRLSYPQR